MRSKGESTPSLEDFYDEFSRQFEEELSGRTAEEVAYDDIIVERLRGGAEIEQAVADANKTYPAEALDVSDANWDDISAHYDYLRNHIDIKEGLTRLRVQELDSSES